MGGCALDDHLHTTNHGGYDGFVCFGVSGPGVTAIGEKLERFVVNNQGSVTVSLEGITCLKIDNANGFFRRPVRDQEHNIATFGVFTFRLGGFATNKTNVLAVLLDSECAPVLENINKP